VSEITLTTRPNRQNLVAIRSKGAWLRTCEIRR